MSTLKGVSSPNVSRNPSVYTDGLRRGGAHIAGPMAAKDESLLAECMDLYNRHYGVWGLLGPRPGEAIRLRKEQLQHLLDHDEVALCTVRLGDDLAGYAIVARLIIPGRGPVHWVTQLVVASQYRKIRIATELLFSAWSFSGAYAWGLATANPYAVRALETTTRRRCRRAEVLARGPEMCKHLHSIADYIPAALATDEQGDPLPIVDSGFFIDHAQIRKMLDRSRRAKRPWDLGRVLPEGHEWFAAIFGDQPTADVDGERLENLLDLGDSVWMQAYARMSLDRKHIWMTHTVAEVDLFVECAESPSRVLDAGCGNGRHARELAARGITVSGVDVVPQMIQQAISLGTSTRVDFRVADMRQERGCGEYDAALALYDVLGSSTTPGDDLAILKGICSHVRRGGHLLLSVMNAHPLLYGPVPVRRVDDPGDLAAALESLPASSTMEKTGNVFNPDLCLSSQGVFFRKEAFLRPGEFLPGEFVVRDRRFLLHELSELLNLAGWDVEWVKPVRAGGWRRDPPLSPEDPAAKELLALATRR